MLAGSDTGVPDDGDAEFHSSSLANEARSWRRFRAAGTRPLIGEKSQGDKHPGFNHVRWRRDDLPRLRFGGSRSRSKATAASLLTLATWAKSRLLGPFSRPIGQNPLPPGTS